MRKKLTNLEASNNVSVIDTSNNNIIATVSVESGPHGVAVTPDGTKVYVANNGDDTVSVINTSTSTVATTCICGILSYRVAITYEGKEILLLISSITVSL
jgi:YVTN family beta-propeller protein